MAAAVPTTQVVGTAVRDRNEHRRLCAIGYTRLFGWRIVPLHGVDAGGRCTCWNGTCDSPTRHPRTTHGLSDARVDLDAIEGSWDKWPTANVGIRRGSALIRLSDASDVDICEHRDGGAP